MMARMKRDRRSYSAGEWGRNRVRGFADPKTGRYQIEWRENGRRLTRAWDEPGRGRTSTTTTPEPSLHPCTHSSNASPDASPSP